MPSGMPAAPRGRLGSFRAPGRPRRAQVLLQIGSDSEGQEGPDSPRRVPAAANVGLKALDGLGWRGRQTMLAGAKGAGAKGVPVRGAENQRVPGWRGGPGRPGSTGPGPLLFDRDSDGSGPGRAERNRRRAPSGRCQTKAVKTALSGPVRPYHHLEALLP